MKCCAAVWLAITACSSNAAPSGASAPVAVVSAPAEPPSESPGGPHAVKVTLADVGLEAASLDRSADPCGDFYQFACGGWLQRHPIPPDRGRWGRFAELGEQNLAVLRGLLEEAARTKRAKDEPKPDAAGKQLGDFYASCMDEAAIERAGTAALRPHLAKLGAIRDARSWLAAVIELHRAGNPVVWSERVEADYKDASTNVVYLDAAGLGLPDRDYYMKPELAAKVAAYQAHVARTLALAGTPAARAAAAAADVVAIERALAALTKTSTERRDIAGMYNPIDAAALAAQTKSIDWAAYWKGRGAAPPKQFVVGTPAFFAQLAALRASFRWPQWTSYFTYHFVHGASFGLPRAFDREAFELTKLTTGAEQPPERAMRCTRAVREGLGDLLGAKYAARLPAGLRPAAQQLVDALVEVMHAELGKLDWMSAATRERAQQKLARLARLIAFPDRWRSYEFAVARTDWFGNRARAAAFETRRMLAKAGAPVDRAEWWMQASDADAYYSGTANSAYLPAGILQPPFFGADRSAAANLGAIGAVIGHELTHGFDDRGAQFDAAGNLANWWAPEDSARFAERGTCLADQYSTFEALPGRFVNGRLTLSENIADLGGVKLAFAAYRQLRKDPASAVIADGFTEDQQFFIAAAQWSCSNERPADTERRLIGDEHAPPKFRIYGALRNLRAFADAFHCAPGTPMNPAKICAVW